MNKKTLATILASSFIVIASIIILLVFFVFKKDDTTADTKLTLSAQDVNLFVGQSTDNFYQISSEDAQIDFYYSDSGIIKIEDGKLTALNRGTATVTIEASLGEKRAEATFNVYVYGYDYYYKVEELHGASFEDGTLQLSGKYCQFQIYLYDYLGERVYEPFNYSITSGQITYDLAFMIAPEEDCQVIIKYPNIDYEIILQVKI